MTAQIIEFKPKATYPDNTPSPKFVLEIFDTPNGFDWHVLSDDLIDEDELSDYVADMFFTLNPDVAPKPGIFRRVAAFIRNLFRPGDDK